MVQIRTATPLYILLERWEVGSTKSDNEGRLVKQETRSTSAFEGHRLAEWFAVGSCSSTSELLDENVITVIFICLCSTSVSDKAQVKLTLMALLRICHPIFPLPGTKLGVWGVFFLKISVEGSATFSYSNALEQHLPQSAALNWLSCPGRCPWYFFVPANTSLYSSNWSNADAVATFVSMHSLTVSPTLPPPPESQIFLLGNSPRLSKCTYAF